ncbi:MAG: hypothetical protein QM766_20125 [Burkholderiaceae bacterium]
MTAISIPDHPSVMIATRFLGPGGDVIDAPATALALALRAPARHCHCHCHCRHRRAERSGIDLPDLC